MFVFNLSQKMINIYKLKKDEKIPDNPSDSVPLWNWYVKPHTFNGKRYVLFLERNTFFSVLVSGINSKNFFEVFC